MKNTFLFFMVCIILFLYPSTQAQTQDVKFGLRAALNFASMYGDDTDDTSIKTGLVAGGLAKISISENFAFQPELLYSQQGTRGAAVSGVRIKLLNDYLNIPLMGKFYVAPNFNLQLGPQIGFLLNTKVKGESGGVDISVNTKELYKKTDFGINAGLEYR